MYKITKYTCQFRFWRENTLISYHWS